MTAPLKWDPIHYGLDIKHLPWACVFKYSVPNSQYNFKRFRFSQVVKLKKVKPIWSKWIAGGRP